MRYQNMGSSQSTKNSRSKSSNSKRRVMNSSSSSPTTYQSKKMMAPTTSSSSVGWRHDHHYHHQLRNHVTTIADSNAIGHDHSVQAADDDIDIKAEDYIKRIREKFQLQCQEE
ncbi:unnamed protein product [Cuscuta europaea]|uniref:Uncharacterized protein n=1 Tax=Cuscuta europaea TaxID=41803 RepID=A0A9P0YR38_CUSEU|nr:unnamed protein product [Cuscuta europaea]